MNRPANHPPSLHFASSPDDMLSAQEEAEAWKAMREGDQQARTEARNKLFLSCERWAAKIAVNYARISKWDHEEAFAAACLITLELIEKFDPRRGRLTTFLGLALPRLLKRERNVDHVIAAPIAYNGERFKLYGDVQRAFNAAQLSTFNYDQDQSPYSLEDHSATDAACLAEHRELVALSHQLVDTLPERTRQVITRIYRRGESPTAIARDFGVTNKRIYQIRNRGLELLMTQPAFRDA